MSILSVVDENGAVSLTALPSLPRWVAWQTETRQPGKSPTKLPYSPNGKKAMADKPATWGIQSAAEAQAAGLPKPFGLGGVGLVLGDLGDGYCIGGLDLDTCRSDDGTFARWVLKIIARFGSYTEVSPSKTGAKVFFTYLAADLPAIRAAMGTEHGKQFKRGGGEHPPAIELHLGHRYFAWTREHMTGTPGELRQVPLSILLWLIREAGPAFVADNTAGSKTKSGSDLFGRDDTAAGLADDVRARIEAAAARRPALGRRWRGDWSGLKDQSRSGKAMSLTAVLKQAGFNQSEMVKALALHPDTQEWAAEASSRDLGRLFEKARTGTKAKRDNPIEAEDLPDWTANLQRDEKGGVIANLANTMTALRSAPELRDCFVFDLMAMTPILVRPVPRGAADDLPRPVQDNDVGQVQEWLQRHELRRIGRDTVHQAVDLHAAENAFHPVQDYLNSLRWDRTERLSSWLHVYMGAKQNAYTTAIGLMFLIAMVARVFKPGCKADYVMILEGLQGALKSTMAAILGGRWFSDSLPDIGSDAVRLVQHVRGKWLIELSELSAMSRAEVEGIKAFITRCEEQFTPKYGRREVKEPRQCVFLGSTNKATYLKDETGGRRFWPVKVETLDTTGLARDRDQLFAEAVHLFRAGARWWPDAAFEAKHIRPQQAARYEADAWEQAISEWLGEGQVDVTVLKVARLALFIETPKLGTADQRRITAAMEQVGWMRNPVRGEHGERYWMKNSDAEGAGNV